jgi:hypothetical protein
MRDLQVLIVVRVPDDVSDDDVLRVINDCIDIGIADAHDTVDSADALDGDPLDDANIATQLEIGRPEAVTIERLQPANLS